MALLLNLGIISHLGQNGTVTPIFRNFRNISCRDLKASISGVSGVMYSTTCTKARMTLPTWNSFCKTSLLHKQSREENLVRGQFFNSGWSCSGTSAGSCSNEQDGSYFGKILGVGLLILMGINNKILAAEPTKVVITKADEAGKSSEAGVNVGAGEVPKVADVAEARRDDQHGSVYEDNVMQNVKIIDPRTEEMLCLNTINEFDFEDFSNASSLFWALVSENRLEEEFIYEEGKVLFDFNDPFYETLGFPSMTQTEITPADVKLLSESELTLLRSSAVSALHENHWAVMQACVQRMTILKEYRAELEGQLMRVEKLKDTSPAKWHSLFKGYLLVNIDNQEAEEEFVKKRNSLHMKEMIVNPVLLGTSESMIKMSHVCSLLGAHEAVATVDEDTRARRIIVMDTINDIEILRNKIVEIQLIVAQQKLEYELQEDKKALASGGFRDWLHNWRRRRVLARRSLLQKKVAHRQQQLIGTLREDLLKRKQELMREITAGDDETQKWYTKSDEQAEEEKRLIAFREKALFAMKARKEKEQELIGKENATSSGSTKKSKKGEEIEKEPMRWARFS